MEKLSRILKIIAKILSFLKIVVGVISFVIFGIIGVGPDGMLSTGARIPSLVNGLLFFILAYLYWLPNEKAQLYKKSYLVITGFFAVASFISIFVMLIIGLFFDSSFRDDAMGILTIGAVVMTCLYSAAPLSLLLHMRAKQS
jgi:hypothetical protein